MNAREDGEKFTAEDGEGRRGDEAMQRLGLDAEPFFISVHSRSFPATSPACLRAFRALLFVVFLS